MPEKSSQPNGENEKSPQAEEKAKKTNPPSAKDDKRAAAKEEVKKKSAAEEAQWKAAGDEESEGWIELPDESDFWKPPARFGSIPVEKEPLGWNKR